MATDERKSLRAVRAAELRTRALRRAIRQSALAMVFLVGALAYALGPEPHARGSLFWTAALIVLSTFQIALAVAAFARVRRWRGRAHWLAVCAWGALSTVLARMLLKR